MPRKSRTSRTRTRRIGLLGLLLASALTPAGILVGTVTAAALVGGLAFHLDRAKPAAPAARAPAMATKPMQPHALTIEHKGEALSLVLAEDDFAGAGNMDPFALAGPSHGHPRGNDAAHDNAGGGVPPRIVRGTPKPDGGHAPGSAHPFSGPTGMPLGGGASPAGSPPGSPPAPTKAGGPSGPTPSGGPQSPASNGPAQPAGEAAAPASPDDAPGGPQGDTPKAGAMPQQGNPPQQPVQPPHVAMPPVTLPATDPGSWEPLPAGVPLDPPMSPTGQKAAAQPNAVPEPSMMALMLLGAAALAWAGRRRTPPSLPA